MRNIVKIFISIALLILLPKISSAAVLYLSPSSGTYNVGDTISMGVYVSSTDQAMNATEGTVSFPNDKLSVISISKSGSIISQFYPEPSFSNLSGTVKFSGIDPDPGYRGSQGKIITIIFRVKAEGVSSLIFSDGSVLANDGFGTNILTKTNGAQFSFIAPPVKETTTTPPKQDVNLPVEEPTEEEPNQIYIPTEQIPTVTSTDTRKPLFVVYYSTELLFYILLGVIIIISAILYRKMDKIGKSKKIPFAGSDKEKKNTIHHAFNLLREDVEEQVRMLEDASTKRELTTEENRIIKQLKKNLDDAESYLTKELK